MKNIFFNFKVKIKMDKFIIIRIKGHIKKK